MRKRHAFTLVELLVVIGIIALLISILLPSLARARQSAVNLQCMANYRSAGQGLLFYANDHKGKLPMSGNGGKPANGEGWVNQWPAQITAYMGGEIRYDVNDQGYIDFGNFQTTYSPILRCPEVPQELMEGAWNGGFHFTANVRAMPMPGTTDGLKQRPLPPYPMATKDSSDKMLLWDGPILPNFGGNAPTANVNQCWWFVTWGPPAPGQTVTWTNWFADPDLGFDENQILPPAPDMAFNSPDRTSPNWIGHVNVDGGATDMPWQMDRVGLQRYRHMMNTSGNFLYFDGHVESKKLGEVRYKDVSIFPY